jgi:hypothetical protein
LRLVPVASRVSHVRAPGVGGGGGDIVDGGGDGGDGVESCSGDGGQTRSPYRARHSPNRKPHWRNAPDRKT